MDNVLQITTVGASVNQFFDSEAQEAMERQFQVLASIGAHAIHLARLFVLQYTRTLYVAYSKRVLEPLFRPSLQHLVQHFWPWRPLNETTLADSGRFWCLSTLLGNRAIQLREAFCQLLADGPVSFQEYLIEISLPYVPESEEEPEYASIMSGNLQRGARKKLRRNQFDFFIRRQKRINSFINKIKRLSEGRNTIVWFGNGGGGPSRQSVKSPQKRFLKQIKKHFESVKVGDEFMTSAKMNCCKVFHRKIYHDDGRVNNAKFDCPRCQTNWSRDISASRNQLEIAISEYFTGTRPEPFERPRRVRRLRRQQ
ncbi:hypothetical protein P9112_001701 [Eukaryota sp. TZLM1-RC]